MLARILCSALGRRTSGCSTGAGRRRAAARADSSDSTASGPGARTPSAADDIIPSPELDGTPLAPSAKSLRDLAVAQKAPRHWPSGSLSAATPANLGAFTLSNDNPQLQVPLGWRPYTRSTVYPRGAGTRDSTGVPMLKIGTKLYDHPVRQAHDGLAALESYRITQQSKYLTQALLDVQRLFTRRVVRNGAYFFPYPYDFALHRVVADTIHAPWYSGMAQGHALSLFTRLADVTGNATWRWCAKATFTSLLLPPVPTNTRLPFVSRVDSAHHLWIDEYAQQPLSKADRTFNGYAFAVFGVWDYYSASHDAPAAQIFRGALSTLRYHVGRGWRTKYWISHYCMTHGVMSPSYHGIHVRQMRLLHALTARSDWAVWSDLFRDDCPTPALTGSVQFAAGTHYGYTFDSAGHPLTSHAMRLSRRAWAPTSQRARIINGTFAGRWVPTAGLTRY